MTRETSEQAAQGARNTEEQLRAEIDHLKRQIEDQKRAKAHPQIKRASTPIVLAILAILAIGFVVAFFAGYLPKHQRELQITAEASAQNESLPEVSVSKAVMGASSGDLLLPGNIQAVTEAPILARAEGFVKKRLVDIGDKVTEGQLLAEIEAPEIEQQVRQAQAAVQQSQADLERAAAALEQGKANESLAKVTAVRWENLANRGVVSKQENDQYQAQYLAQAANVRALNHAVAAGNSNVSAAKANVQRLTEMLSYLKVRAPFAGVVTLRNVDVGALVNNGNTMLYRIAQTNPLRTYLNVAQANASDIHVGQTAELSTTDLPDRKFQGKVTRTSNALDPSSRTLLVEVQVPNPEGKLIPGMYVQVNLNLPRRDPPVLVQSDTLVVRPEGTLVALVNAEHVVHFQPILVGRDLGDRIEVLSGLKAGQQVIVNPNDSVQEGVKVRPVLAAEGGPAKKRGR